ncbi:hypothetical protein [Bradyrhizobium prioriisuperbiae]|uniref:hypothetical protein n=1 Tax=Bradyrhizobium prioriisuperbiae TaxID=2854389 RepID=UPI0028E6A197|nr:hypothetical protein [Bradyrhizobium prioritasuperba]
MPLILKIAIIGGGGAMLHWALDMGPAFAALYLGALAALLATAIWHVIRSPAPTAIDRTPVTAATPRPSNEAAPQLPRDPPSRVDSPIANAIAVGFCVAIPAFLSWPIDWAGSRRRAHVYALFSVLFIVWLGSLAVVLELLFDTLEAR